MLWALIAAMTAAVLALLLPPLLRRPTGIGDRAAFDMEVYRDQNAEIGRDLERGLISEREAVDARAEIGRRLLTADRQMSQQTAGEDDGAAPADAGRAGPTVAAIAVLVPVAAVALYLAIGSPWLTQSTPGGGIVAERSDEPDGARMAALVEDLGRRLKDRPDDADGWALYARSLAGLGRTGAALDAFRRAVALDPKNTELLSRFAEIQILAASGTVTPEARRTLDAVLALDRDEPRARYYVGLAEQQAGRLRQALELWLALEAESPPDAPWRTLLARRVERLAKQFGIDGDALAAMREKVAKRPAPDDPGAMIHAMVERLAARLDKQPDDAEGWRRLARSYRVLGEPAKARDALARAVALLPDDVTVLSDYAVAIVQAADKDGPLPPELLRVTTEILKRKPDHPSALWFGGVARLQAGDNAGALDRWKRLRVLLKPGTRQHEEITKRIEGLEKTAEP